jgi:hypothetical protein
MRTGDVVVVGVKLDERLRKFEGIQRGTIVELTSTTCWVLLSNGDIWVGQPREVYEDQSNLDTETEEEIEEENHG